MRSMKYLIAMVLALSGCTVPAWGEGIASVSDVTAANRTVLKLHQLKVILKERKGLTSIHLHVTPKGSRLALCDVVIHRAGQGDDVVVARFSLDPSHRPMPLWVANELVDEVAITYHLVDEAGDHVFQIKRGGLRALAEPAKGNP